MLTSRWKKDDIGNANDAALCCQFAEQLIDLHEYEFSPLSIQSMNFIIIVIDLIPLAKKKKMGNTQFVFLVAIRCQSLIKFNDQYKISISFSLRSRLYNIFSK